MRRLSRRRVVSAEHDGGPAPLLPERIMPAMLLACLRHRPSLGRRFDLSAPLCLQRRTVSVDVEQHNSTQVGRHIQELGVDDATFPVVNQEIIEAKAGIVHRLRWMQTAGQYLFSKPTHGNVSGGSLNNNTMFVNALIIPAKTS